MKHTYIFIPDHVVTEMNLFHLARAARRYSVSYKTEMADTNYTSVQVFTDNITMHQIASSTGWSGEQLRDSIPAARRRGETATLEAAKRLDDLRRKASIRSGNLRHPRPPSPSAPDKTLPPWAQVRIERVQAAGCKIYMVPIDVSYRIFDVVVFDESFTLTAEEAIGFLQGLEKGFTSAPMWASVKQVVLHGSTKATRRSKRSA
jgi:hypothetical protein